jgi:hypothetical protein
MPVGCTSVEESSSSALEVELYALAVDDTSTSTSECPAAMTASSMSSVCRNGTRLQADVIAVEVRYPARRCRVRRRCTYGGAEKLQEADGLLAA